MTAFPAGRDHSHQAQQELPLKPVKSRAMRTATSPVESVLSNLASWLGPDGEEESIEMTATPAAIAYFERVMSRDEA
ncbi:hypothetical protein EYC87_03810 [Halieaceae bacterium IMCC8485]|jgi:hypothetical protein|uniref:Uncharacterized protein n=1 Tax=Candidatus Seongchinamella marina TaxID=2518990 RepID=A0ABT3SRU7_9GAMM|nr:hypothetical protein [Candidatus Seongchinamella marina]MCX2972712.1 hypothetical protein [Candidatus Seongchinamella marina]